MRPEKLTLRNFGPFAGQETIDFSALDNLFLITGKTGSGKTTIFDALCFALYGSVPGSRRAHIARLRSDYAGEDEECFVSLEFSVGEKRYRVDRGPKQEKRRGGSAPGVTAFYEIIRGEAVSTGAKKSEADGRIRELIGLETEEFFKIVLLPQGEFAEFLKQNTTERRAVLGKLFPVDRAVRLRELAQEKARDAAAESREAERALGEIAKRVSFDSYDEAHTRAAKNLEDARARLVRIAEETARGRDMLALRRREAESLARLEGLRVEMERFESGGAAARQKEERLALSRKAQPLRPYLILAETGKGEAEQAEAGYASARRAKAAIQVVLSRAEEQAAAIPALEKEARALMERRPLLAAMLEEEEKLRRDAGEAETLRSRLKALAVKKAALGEELAKKETEIGASQERAAETEGLNARWEVERAILDRLVELKKIAGDAESLAAEQQELELRLKGAQESREELAGRIPVLEGELKKLREEKERRERADMAAHLGADLRPGQPCPVCGSPEHPLPAAALAPVFGMAERIASLEHAVKDAGGSLAARNAELESRREAYTRLEKRRGALQERTAAARKDCPPAEDPALARFLAQGVVLPGLAEASRFLEAHRERLNRITAQRSEAQRAQTRLAELYRERHTVQTAAGEFEKEYAGLEEKHRNLAAELSRLQARHDAEQRPAAAALGELERRLKETEDLVREYREKREDAGRNFAAAAAGEEQARGEHEERKAQYEAAAAALGKALAASPFAGAEALTRALLSETEEAQWEEELRRRHEERSRLDSLTAELGRGLEEIRREGEKYAGYPLREDIEAKLGLLAQEQREAETERDRAAGELLALERDRAALQEAHERFQRLAARSGILSSLADDLGGKNPKKTSFDAWLLGRYLAEVALFATRRLERMSEGRYSLLLDSAGESSRGRAGLDLAVFDANTGKTRPCATLSGGESFMASISLALGLADSIQSRAGGVRLDAVFIDEGFGSLDEGSLDKALIILDELRNQRMVGLISHVGELRSRIPSRIEVIKTGGGSRIRYDESVRTEQAAACEA